MARTVRLTQDAARDLLRALDGRQLPEPELVDYLRDRLDATERQTARDRSRTRRRIVRASIPGPATPQR